MDIATFKIKVISPTPFPDKLRLKLQKALQSWFVKTENHREKQEENKGSVLSFELMDGGTCAEVQITPSTGEMIYDHSFQYPFQFKSCRC